MQKQKSFSASDIIQIRLHNQLISCAQFKRPEEVVEWFGAVQAQDYPGAKWSIALRIPGTKDEDIENTIAEKKIIRTWPIRGTLHFVSAKDIHWMLSLVEPRIITGNKTRETQLGLNEKIYKKANDILLRILKGKSLTRDEITDKLKQSGIKADGVKLSHILQRAGLKKNICFSVRREKQFTYTLLNLSETKTLERDEALAELAKRYFQSHGPAALQDFIWWSGLSAGESRKAIEIIKSKLVKKILNNKIFWMSEKVQLKKSPDVYLLPGFDEYLIGYKDRTEIINKEHFKRLNAGGGFLSPTIIIKGRVTGTWKREFKRNKVIISIRPFNAFNKSEKKKIIKAGERYGEFINMDVEINES